jgi:hypothetical protein
VEKALRNQEFAPNVLLDIEGALISGHSWQGMPRVYFSHFVLLNGKCVNYGQLSMDEIYEIYISIRLNTLANTRLETFLRS